jgi:DNA invertase Pin-like site-specific DNA recombinase
LVRSSGLDRVIVHRLDRLSRDLRHYVSLGQEFRQHEVALTVVAAPELGAAALDNLALNMMASFAEFDK